MSSHDPAILMKRHAQRAVAFLKGSFSSLKSAVPEPHPNHANLRAQVLRVKDKFLPIRTVTHNRSSGYYLRLARLVWRYALFSLPLDLFLIGLINTPRSVPYLQRTGPSLAVILLLCTAALFSSGELLFERFEKLRALIYRKRAALQKYAPLLGLGILGVALIEIALRFGRYGAPAIAIAVLVGVRSFKSIQQALLESAQRRAALTHDRILLIEHLNLQHFLYALTPILAARLAALVAMVESVLSGQELVSYLPVGATSLLVLWAVAPGSAQFMAPCKQCSRITSRALSVFGSCPLCNRRDFLVSPLPGTEGEERASRLLKGVVRRAVL